VAVGVVERGEAAVHSSLNVSVHGSEYITVGAIEIRLTSFRSVGSNGASWGARWVQVWVQNGAWAVRLRRC
jgi:hypothetical protein